MIDAARAWNKVNPDASVSQFACQFPGKYKEAANALRRVRKEEKNDETHA